MVCGRGTASPLMPEDTSLPVPRNLRSFLPQNVMRRKTGDVFRGNNVTLMDQSMTVYVGIQLDDKKELPCLTRMIKLSNEGEGKHIQERCKQKGDQKETC